MTVKEIFELRKQGKIEEAYDAIRPMYAAHKGRYTSLCMFWTAADIFKKRLREGRIDEAAKIYEALKRVLPYIKDSDTQPETASDFHDDGTPKFGIDKEPSRTTDSAAAFMQTAVRRLTQARQLEQLEQSRQEKPRASETNFCEFRDLATFRNPQEESLSESKADHSPSKEYISATSTLSAGQEEEPSASEEASNSPSKSEQEDLSGHLAVSLDEGIIRPIEGLNAIQRVILACVVGYPGYSATKISESTGIPQSLIDHNLAILIDRSLIEPRKGELNTAEYYPI